MAFMKYSKSITPAKTVNEKALLQGLGKEEIVQLLKRHLEGKNIGFIPSEALLKEYGLR